MLTICCYEIPESLKKYLYPILTKLQAGETDVYARSPTLEFLMALGNVPSMTSNFTIDEFKRFFAIAFRYIEHASYSIQSGLNSEDVKGKDSKARNERAGAEAMVQAHAFDAEVDKGETVHPSTRPEVSPILYQYLLTVSYAVIARWFIKVNLNDRPEISSFIVRNIIACSGTTDDKTRSGHEIALGQNSEAKSPMLEQQSSGATRAKLHEHSRRLIKGVKKMLSRNRM